MSDETEGGCSGSTVDNRRSSPDADPFYRYRCIGSRSICSDSLFLHVGGKLVVAVALFKND
jgi:uncharacterized protein YuzB (UPF0349 family)